MFRQHWQTMLNKCCLNGPVPTGTICIKVSENGYGAQTPKLMAPSAAGGPKKGGYIPSLLKLDD